MSDSEQTVNGIGTALAACLTTYKEASALPGTPTMRRQQVAPEMQTLMEKLEPIKRFGFEGPSKIVDALVELVRIAQMFVWRAEQDDPVVLAPQELNALDTVPKWIRRPRADSGDVAFDALKQEITVGGRSVCLNNLRFYRLVEHLYKARGRVVSSAEIRGSVPGCGNVERIGLVVKRSLASLKENGALLRDMVISLPSHRGGFAWQDQESCAK